MFVITDVPGCSAGLGMFTQEAKLPVYLEPAARPRECQDTRPV